MFTIGYEHTKGNAYVGFDPGDDSVVRSIRARIRGELRVEK